MIAVDFSFSHPDPAQLARDGVTLVVRYTTGSKALTPAERDQLQANRLAIALVHETLPDRVNTGGSQGGANDALQANGFADDLGYPDDCVIFYACDTAPNLGGATLYFQGVRARTKRPVGWYGGMQVGLTLKAAGLVDVVWVANAASWSGFRHWADLAPVARTTPGVSMLQGLAHPLVGIDPSIYDIDEIITPFPAWGIVVPKPKPVPPPVQAPPIARGDNVNSVDIKGIHLDEHGNGYIDVKGVSSAAIVATVVLGGSDPAKVARYDKTPIARVVAGSAPLRLVIEGGEPKGVYTVRVSYS